MKFEREGTHKVTITKAETVPAKFAPEPAFDVALTVRDAEGHSDEWLGEVSDRYFHDKMQRDITNERLASLGYQFGEDLSELHTLEGVETEVFVAKAEKNGKTFFNVKYIGERPAREPISKDQIKARLQAIYGRAPSRTPLAVPAPATATATATAAAPATANPKAAGKHNPYA